MVLIFLTVAIPTPAQVIPFCHVWKRVGRISKRRPPVKRRTRQLCGVILVERQGYKLDNPKRTKVSTYGPQLDSGDVQNVVKQQG